MKKVFGILLMLFCVQVVAQTPTQTTLISKIDAFPQFQMWDNEPVLLMGYSYLIGAPLVLPAPTLEYNEGDSVNLLMWNLSQGPPHTIHLHGLDVDQQNDGVPSLSFDVAHDDTGSYHFIAPHAGTYLYHCHVVSPVHVQAGMYGMIIIRPPDGSYTTWDGGYAYDSEDAWLLSEVDTTWHSEAVLDHEHNDTVMVHPVPTIYEPQYFLVNGKSESQLAADSIEISGSENEVIYLRLANIGYCGNRVIFPSGLNAQTVSSDGRPLPNSVISDTVDILPGERFGVLLQADGQFADQVEVEYFNLNTGEVKNTQFVEVDIDGVFGTEEVEQSIAIEVFPNPASNEVALAVDQDLVGQCVIKIFDTRGRLVQENTLNNLGSSEQNLLDVSALSNGVYCLNLSIEGITTTKRLIISR